MSSSNNTPPARNPFLYKILGLPHGAPIADVKKAFRELALKHHPDKNVASSSPTPSSSSTSETAADLFKRVTEAYQYLSSPENKVIYDGKYQPFKGGGGGDASAGGTTFVRSTSRHVFGTRRYESSAWCNNTSLPTQTSTMQGGATAASGTTPSSRPSSSSRRFSSSSRGTSANSTSFRRTNSASSPPGQAAASTRFTPEQEAYYKQRDRERGRELAKKVNDQRRKEQQDELDRLQREDARHVPKQSMQEVRGVQLSSFGLNGSSKRAGISRPSSAQRVRRASDLGPAMASAYATQQQQYQQQQGPPPVSSPSAAGSPRSPLSMSSSSAKWEAPPPPATTTTTTSSSPPFGSPLSSPASAPSPSPPTSYDFNPIMNSEQVERTSLMKQESTFWYMAVVLGSEEERIRITSIRVQEVAMRAALDTQASAAIQALRGGQAERSMLVDYSDMLAKKFQRLEQQRWELLLLCSHEEPLARAQLVTEALTERGKLLPLYKKEISLQLDQERIRGSLDLQSKFERSVLRIELYLGKARVSIHGEEAFARDEIFRRMQRGTWGVVSEIEMRLKSSNVSLLAENVRLKKECANLHRDLAQSAVSYGGQISNLKGEILELQQRLLALQDEEVTSESHNSNSTNNNAAAAAGATAAGVRRRIPGKTHVSDGVRDRAASPTSTTRGGRDRAASPPSTRVRDRAASPFTGGGGGGGAMLMGSKPSVRSKSPSSIAPTTASTPLRREAR